MAGADNLELNAGSGGDLLATDTISGTKHQEVKVQFGAPGTATNATPTSPLPVAYMGNGTQNLNLYRYLDTNGDGTGTKDASVDGSGTQQIFKITPPAGTIYRIARMLIYIQDGSGFAAAEYGNLGTTLTTGIGLRIHNGTTTVLDLMDGVKVQQNADWARCCYDANLVTWGAGDEFLVVRWTFERAGQMLRLDGDATESLEILIDDNLTGLTSQYFQVQGYTEDSAT